MSNLCKAIKYFMNFSFYIEYFVTAQYYISIQFSSPSERPELSMFNESLMRFSRFALQNWQRKTCIVVSRSILQKESEF